jgi:hypothetical protein
VCLSGGSRAERSGPLAMFRVGRLSGGSRAERSGPLAMFRVGRLSGGSRAERSGPLAMFRVGRLGGGSRAERSGPLDAGGPCHRDSCKRLEWRSNAARLFWAPQRGSRADQGRSGLGQEALQFGHESVELAAVDVVVGFGDRHHAHVRVGLGQGDRLVVDDPALLDGRPQQ